MKRIIVSLGVIGVVAATVIAASGAFFSTKITSYNNTIQTASMTIAIDHTGYPTNMRILDGRNMYPGAFVQSAVEIKNNGSVGFNPELALANANNDKSINQYLWFEVWTNGKLWYSGPITSFPGYDANAHVILDKVAAGGSELVAFRAILQETAPDSVAGGTYMVDLNVTGHQWNDPSYQPTSATADTGYVVNTWSYNVCGVRPYQNYALKAGQVYNYDYHVFSPFYSYIVNTPMANNNDLWAVQTLPNSYYQGFVDAADGYCTLTDQAPTPLPTVGAKLSAYTQPTNCKVTVVSGGSIQAAIDNSIVVDGDTVCVYAGTYNENVNVSKSITLAGAGVSTTIINGQSTGYTGGLNISASNVRVEGFKITGLGLAGMYIHKVSNVVVSYNEISNTASTHNNNVGANALLADGGVLNLDINNNVFSGNSAQLVYVNGTADVSVASTAANFTSNTFSGNATGPLLGNNADNSTVSMNKFAGAPGSSSPAVGTFTNTLKINTNNFDKGSGLEVGGPTSGTAIDATNNWWGDLSPVTHVSGQVNYTPFASSAYPEY